MFKIKNNVKDWDQCLIELKWKCLIVFIIFTTSISNNRVQLNID